MAEAFLRKHAGDQFEAYSAGLEPKGIHPYAQKVMEEIGLGLAGQYSKGVEEYMGKTHFGYLITVCAHAERNCPAVFPGIDQRLHWALKDPASFEGADDEKLDRFRQVRDQIDHRIKIWLADLGTEVGGN
jgi:arsenate reductase